MEAWVIKRNDGKYFDYVEDAFVSDFSFYIFHDSKELAEGTIECHDLKDCKVVKVEIREVEE